MKRSHTKLKYVVLLLILMIFSFTSSTVVTPSQVGAQDIDIISGRGSACIPNRAECPAGQVNLVEAIESGDISVFGLNMTPNSVISYLTEEWEEDVNHLCVSETIKDIVKIWRNEAAVASFDIRFCPVGSEAQKTPVSGSEATILGVQGWEVVGCCPTSSPDGYDYQLVTLDNSFGDGDPYQESVICCPVLPDAQRGGLLYPHKNEKDIDLIFRAGGNRCEDIENTNLDEIYAQRGLQRNPDPDFTDKSIINAAGNNLNSTENVTVNENAGASETCSESSTCSLISDPESAISDGYRITDADGDTDSVVVSPETLETSELTCDRCFADGEAIAIGGDNEHIVLCDASSPNLVEIVPLNGLTLEQRLAVLQADELNRPIAERCLQQGGIYTAVGCIDPSPLGILTGLIRIALGVIGGVALVQLLIAGLAYQSGNEEQIQKAQGRIFATFGGLALLVFSVLIMRIIGVNILDVIPEGLI